MYIICSIEVRKLWHSIKETLLFTLKPAQETQYNEKLPNRVFFYIHLKTLYFSLSSSLFQSQREIYI